MSQARVRWALALQLPRDLRWDYNMANFKKSIVLPLLIIPEKVMGLNISSNVRPLPLGAAENENLRTSNRNPPSNDVHGVRILLAYTTVSYQSPTPARSTGQQRRHELE